MPACQKNLGGRGGKCPLDPGSYAYARVVRLLAIYAGIVIYRYMQA